MSTTEKKTINYKGMELPCIDSGYWSNGVTLVMCDGDCTNAIILNFIEIDNA